MYGVNNIDEGSYTWWSDHGEVVSGQGTDTIAFQWTNSIGCPVLYSRVENSFGCISDTASLYIQLDICDGLEELDVFSFKLFPVPVQDQLWIESTQEYDRIELINMKGVLENDVTYSGGSIDFSKIPSGAYLLRIFDQKDRMLYSRTIIKR